MDKTVSRRRLLSCTGRAAAGAVVAAAGTRIWAEAGAPGANDRIGLALVGCGRRGQQLLDVVLKLGDVGLAMVCDVDATRAAAAADRVEKAGRPRPAIVGDFLRVLGSREVHGVIVATPDHWHAIQLMYACLAGKDVYVEAPISHNVAEGIAMMAATRRRHRVVQVGLQQRAGVWFEKAVQQVRSRRLGRIAQTRSWTFMKAAPIDRTPDGEPPSQLDFERWLGPAPERAYNPGRVSGHVNWWDYGGGVMGLWNVHLQDVVHWAMQVNAPLSVTAVGGNMGLEDFRETPDTLEIVCEYGDARGRFVHAYSLRMNNGQAVWGPSGGGDGARLASAESPHAGTQFHGDQGTLFVDRKGAALLPPGAGEVESIGKPVAIEGGEPVDLLTLEHVSDFVRCMRSRSEPRAPIEAGYWAGLPCHLANIAYRVGRKLYYDAGKRQCFADPEHTQPDAAANALLTRQHRAPYLLPAV